MSTKDKIEAAFEKEYAKNYGRAWDSNKSFLNDLYRAGYTKGGEEQAALVAECLQIVEDVKTDHHGKAYDLDTCDEITKRLLARLKRESGG